MSVYEICDLLISFWWLILWCFALSEGKKYIQIKKDQQVIHNQSQTSHWDYSHNIGRDFTPIEK